MAFDDGVKTVSGSVAHTDDASTKVPFVSVKCGIEPTLTGVTEIDVVRPDGNILQTVAESKEQNGVTWTVNSDGSITLSGKSTARTYLYVHLYHKILPKDATLTVSVEGLYDNGASDVFLNLPYSDNGTTYSGTYGQVTWGSPKKTISYTADKYIGFLLDCPANVTTNQTIKIMVTIGSDAKAFEPYVAPVTDNVELGRTIHGGSADIVNGTGKETYAEIDMGDLTWTYDSTYSRFISSSLPDCIKIDTARTTPILCSAYQVISDGRPLSQVPDKSIYLSFHSSGSPLTDAFVHDSDYTDATAFKTAVTGQKIVYQLKDSARTDFTFTPITPTPETVGKVNNVYCNTGDTEVTYHDNAHGFSEVTVNKTGKNLFDKNAVTNNTWIVVDGTATESATGYRTSSYIPVKANTRYYVSTKSSNRSAYYDKNGNGIAYFAFSGGTSFNSLYDGYIRITIKNDIDLDTFVVNEGSEAIPYEPFGIGKTAYLHKVIYGGKADVVKGTCEPKNLIDDNTIHQFASNYITIGGTLQYNYTYFLKAGTYTISLGGVTAYAYIRKQNTTTNTIIKGKDVSNATFTIDEDSYYAFWLYNNTDNISVEDVEFIQIEVGSTKTDYAPHFEPFTFPPISIGTDEGENTLFANEGDSAITYRKAVD